VLDNYSGPASCLWSLRSLIVAFHLRSDSPFWTTPVGQLPIDRDDYRVEIPAAGWTIEGNHQTGSVEIRNTDSLPSKRTQLASYGLMSRVKALLHATPHRPDNEEAKYRRAVYSSARPFCGCR
jgi:hypothetical protein